MQRTTTSKPSEPTPTSKSRPRLERCRNLTPFEMFKCDKMGPGRLYYDVVILKGTFTLTPDRLQLAHQQVPIELADIYHDPENATRSSVERAGDVVVAKPSTDVLVTGTARPPRGAPRRQWIASVGVYAGSRQLVAHALRVTGPRVWHHRTLSGWVLSDPEPTTGVPIRYELSYGGAYPDPDHAPRQDEAHRWVICGANPSGRGHWDPRVLDRGRTYEAPQWLDPRGPEPSLLADLPLAGFAPVARWWRSRHQHAGTYDRAWKERARAEAAQGWFPDYPHDFDARFFQCAPPGLVSPQRLRGDEKVTLSGLCAEAEHVDLELPGVVLLADLFDAQANLFTHPLPLDTVHVDLDARAVSLTWRLTVLQQFDIRQAVLRPREAL